MSSTDDTQSDCWRRIYNVITHYFDALFISNKPFKADFILAPFLVTTKTTTATDTAKQVAKAAHNKMIEAMSIKFVSTNESFIAT